MDAANTFIDYILCAWFLDELLELVQVFTFDRAVSLKWFDRLSGLVLSWHSFLVFVKLSIRLNSSFRFTPRIVVLLSFCTLWALIDAWSLGFFLGSSSLCLFLVGSGIGFFLGYLCLSFFMARLGVLLVDKVLELIKICFEVKLLSQNLVKHSMEMSPQSSLFRINFTIDKLLNFLT